MFKRYIKEITHLIEEKRVKPTGFLVSGGREFQRSLLVHAIMLGLKESDEMTIAPLDLTHFETDDLRVAAIKREQRVLKKSSNKSESKLLVIESLDQLVDHRMVGIRLLISCQSMGIHLLVSPKEPIVHLVGLSDFMIRVLSSEKVFSDVYRLSTQKVLFRLTEEEVGIKS